ncbi:MAG: methyltransferase domain-containing protein [Hyphomicrobiaceae bacterium]
MFVEICWTSKPTRGGGPVLDVIQAYASKAPSLIERFNAISSADLYAPVIDLLPSAPMRTVDVGAGTGRDAAWLASMGHTVVAVEPVKAFRDAGLAAYEVHRIEWLDDRLPELIETQRRGQFGLVLLCAVWQHLDAGERVVAMHSLARLAAPGGLLVMSLRHGDGAPDRTVHPVLPEDTIAQASREGLTLVRRLTAPSIQPLNHANGVTWTWLAFRA